MAGEWDVVAEQPVNAAAKVSRGASPWDVVAEAPVAADPTASWKPFQPGVRDITAPEALVRAGKAFAGRASEYAGAPVVGLADLLSRAQAALTGTDPGYGEAADRLLGVRDARAFADAQAVRPGERADRFGQVAIPAGGEFGKMVPEMVVGGSAASRIPYRAAEASTPYINAAMDFLKGAVTGAPTATRAGREKAEQLRSGGASDMEAGLGGAATSAMTLAQFGAPVAAPARAATLPMRVAERGTTGAALGASANSAQTQVENMIAGAVAPGAPQLQVDPFSAEVLAMGAIPGAVMGQMAGRTGRPQPSHADLGYGPPEPPLAIVPPEPAPPRPPVVVPPLELVRPDAPAFTPPRPDVSEPAGRVPVAPDWEIAPSTARQARRDIGEDPVPRTEAGITELVAKALKDQPQARYEGGIARTVEDVARESGVPVKVEPPVEALPYGPPDATPAARTAARVEADTNAMRPDVPMRILKTLDTVARESELPRTVQPRIIEVGADNAESAQPAGRSGGGPKEPPGADLLGGGGEPQPRPGGSGERAGNQPDVGAVPRGVDAGSGSLGEPAARRYAGKYRDGGDWGVNYRTVPLADGGYALVRVISDSDGTRIEHLKADGTWAKGEPAKSVMHAGRGVEVANSVESFPTERHALEAGAADATGNGGKEIDTPAAAPAAPQKLPPKPKATGLLGAIIKAGGLNPREMRDLTGEGRTGVAGVPVGLFKNPKNRGEGVKSQGFGLDEMVVRLRQEGFNIPDDPVDGGVGALRDMIRDEVSGKRTYGDNAEAMHEYEAARRAKDDADYDEYLATDPFAEADALYGRATPEEYAAARDAEQANGEAPDGWSKMSEAEKDAELDKIFGRPDEAKGAGTRAGDAQEAVGRAGERPDLQLEQPTEAGLRARAAESERAAAEQRRVEAAPPPEDFVLSGSNRPADEAAARGQQELPGADTKTGTPGKLMSGPPLEEMWAFGKEVAGRALGPWKDWKEAGLKLTAAAKAVADAFATKAKAAMSKDTPAGGESIPGAIGRAIFYNAHSHIKSFGEAWNSPTIGKIADMIYSTAGKAQEGQSFHEATGDHIAQRQRPLSDIVGEVERLRKAGVSDEQIIRQVEHPEARQGDIGKVAAKIEKWLSEERDYQMEAGAELGEQKNYFPREYDKSKIIPRQADFVKDATRAYEAMGLSGEDARQAAEAFWYRRAYGSEGSPSFKPEGGNAAFTKARELTPEAAEHLRAWRTESVGDTLNAYLMRSTRRAEIARRFGDGWSRWEGLEREIIKEAPGITQEALRELRSMTASAMGLRAQSMSVAAHTGAQYLRLWTTLATMPKAALSSIAETWVPLVRANGDLAVTVNHLRNVLYENSKSLLNQALMGKRTDAQQRLFDFAEDIGALSQSPLSHMMADRWMGGDVESKAVSAITSKFFRLNLLEPMTTWQRAISVDAARIWLRRLSKNMEGGRKDADLFLRELGVPEGKTKEFAAYVRKMGDDLPDAGNLTGDMGNAYRQAITRFVNQSIQNPNAATRPSWANTDWGAVVFQLQGFNNAFHKNVLLRQANLLKEGFKGDYTAAERAALMGGMIPGLMLSAATAGLVWEIRDRLYNKEPRERTTQAKVERAISAAGLTGALDPYLQMIGGIRYQRSPAASAGGPSFGAVDSVISTLGQYVANNSDKTNAAERKAADTFYQWGVEPAATLLLAASPAPVAPATQALTVLALPAARQTFVDAAAGPKPPKKQKPIRGIFEPRE